VLLFRRRFRFCRITVSRWGAFPRETLHLLSNTTTDAKGGQNRFSRKSQGFLQR
jgi:hypothetical protein